MTAAELAGGFGRPDAQPVANLIEQSFLRRVRALPVEMQRLLLAAAAEPVGAVAAEVLGIGADAAAPAEADGLIELGARVRFRHPLARSAAYRAAAVRERQEIHRTLAEVTDPSADPDRRAWHRAQAAPGPVETVTCVRPLVSALTRVRDPCSACWPTSRLHRSPWSISPLVRPCRPRSRRSFASCGICST